MENLKSHLNHYFWLYLAGAVVLIALIVFGFWLKDKIETSELDNQVQTNTEAATEQKQTAINANANALNYSIERKVEDNRRETDIKPKLEAARSSSQNSKTQVEKLTKELKENEKNLHDSNANRADNCRELLRLFPNERFEYCKS